MGSLFGSSSGAAHPELAEATDAALAALRAGSGQVAGTEVRARAHERDEGSARARSRGSTRTAPGKTQKRDRELSSPRRCSPRAFADTTATPRALISPPFLPSLRACRRCSARFCWRARASPLAWRRLVSRSRRNSSPPTPPRSRPPRLRARARDREARERPERRGRAHAAPVPAARADDPSAPRGVPLRPRGRGESLDAVFPLPGSRRGRARGRARRFEPPRIGIPRDPVRGVPRRILGRVRVRAARRGGGDGGQAVDVVFDRADARDAAAAAALVADLVALADGWRANWLEANPSSSTAALAMDALDRALSERWDDLFMRSDALRATVAETAAPNLRKKLRAGSSLDDAPPREGRAAVRLVGTLIRGGLRETAVAPFPDISAEFLAALIASLEEEMPPWRRAATLETLRATAKDASALARTLDLDAERGTTTLADLVTIVARIVQAGAAPQPDSGVDDIMAAVGAAFKARADGSAPDVGSFFARGGRLGGGGGAGEGGAHDAPNYNAEARDAGGFSGDAHVAHAVALAVEATLAATFSVAALADEADEVAAEPATATTGDDATPRGVLAVARARAVGALESTWEPLLSALVVALEEARGEALALSSFAGSRRSRKPPARRRDGGAGRVPRRAVSLRARAGRRAEARGAGSGFGGVFVFVFGGSGQGGGGGIIGGALSLGAGAAGAMGAVGSAAASVAASPVRGAVALARVAAEGASRSGAPRSSLARRRREKQKPRRRSFPPPPRRRATASPRSCSRRRTSRRSGRSSTSRTGSRRPWTRARGPWSSARSSRWSARWPPPRRRRRSRRRWGPGRRRSAASAGSGARTAGRRPRRPRRRRRAALRELGPAGGRRAAALAEGLRRVGVEELEAATTRTPPLGRRTARGPGSRRRRGDGTREGSSSPLRLIAWNASWTSR